MKKVSDTQAKTPSGTTRTEEILDDISVLVGQISKAEDLCVSNLETLSSAIDAKLLETIVHNTEVMVEFSFTQSNMLMGIAGYLLGDKGINPTANAASLLGKIKNNEPLFLGPTEGSKFYGDLLEEILAKYVPTSTGADSGSGSATLNVVLSSADGGNLDSLIELIKELQKTGSVENIEVLTAIQSLMKKLDKIGKTEVDTELISMKMDDVQLAMFNIGETFNELSNLERRMKGIDIKVINTGFNTLSKFNFAGNLKNMEQLIDFINDVAQLKVPKNINKNIAENTDRITEFIKVLVPFYTEMEKVPKVNYKKTIKNVIKNVNALPDLVDAITSLNLKGINASKTKQLNILVAVIDQLYKLLNHIEVLSSNDYEDALDVFSDDILPYFESGKKKGLVERISDIPFKKFNKTTLKQMASFEFTILSFGDVLKSINKMVPRMTILNVFDDIIFGSVDVINKLIVGDKDKKQIGLTDLVETLKTINKKAGILVTFNNMMSSIVDIFKSLMKVGIFAMLASAMDKSIFKGIETLNLLSKELENNLNVKDIKDKQEIVHHYKLFLDDLLSMFAKIPLIGILGFIVVAFKKPLIKAINVLSDVIDIINENVSIPEINASIDNIHPYAELMKDLAIIFGCVTLAGFLSIPAIVGGLLLTAAIKVVFQILGKSIQGISKLKIDKETKSSIDDLTKIIIVIGGLMLVAALTGWIVTAQFANIMGFLGVFLIFLSSITLVIALIGGLMTLFKATDAVKAMSELGTLILSLTGCMIIGALFMLTGLWVESLLFGAVLTAFITMVLLPFVILGLFFKKAITGGKDMALLIVTCALVMMLGAVFMMTGLWKEALLFGLVLAAFITLVMLPFIIFGGKKVFKTAEGMVKLIITCSLILTLGAFLMMIPGFFENALKFGALVFGFVFLIVGTFALFGKQIKKSIGAVYGILAIIVVSSLCVMLGAEIIETYGWENPLIFASIVVGMIVILGGAAALLSLMGATIFIGVGAMAAIAIIVVIGAASLNILGDAFQKFGDWKKAVAMAGVLAGTILAFGVLAIALGAMTLIPFFWMGIAAVGAIAGIVLIISVAFKNIAEALTMLTQLKGKEIDGESLTAMVDSFIGIAKKLESVEDEISTRKIKRVANSMIAVGKMMSQLGISVQDVANLKVATGWDSDGNPTDYRQLDSKDFVAAAVNTKTIIMTLGQAIIDTYNNAPEGMFNGTGLFGFGSSPFDKVVRSCTGMSKMISAIGKSVGEISNLNVATEWDSDGNPIAFRQLDSGDFKKAASNIKEIITVLGGAIMATYKANKEMFEVPPIEVGGLFFKVKIPGKGKTPFEKTVTACTAMGGMISSIANGVKDMADLKIATKWDSKGNAIEWRHLDKSDFELAGEQVGNIVTTLGAALTTVYNNNPEMFQAGWEFKDGKVTGGNDTPMVRVINAASLMGTAMSSIAGGVKDMADLRIEEYDANGKPTGRFKSLKEPDFQKAATNVGTVVSCLALALDGVYKTHGHMFDEVVTYTTTSKGWGRKETHKHVSDAPIVKVLSSAGNLGTFISDCAAAVKAMADLSFVDSSGKSVKLDLNKDLGKNGTVARNIEAVVSCIGQALIGLYDKGKDTYFNPNYEGLTNMQTSFDKVTKLTQTAIKTITTIQETINKVGNTTALTRSWTGVLEAILNPLKAISVETDVAKQEERARSIRKELDNAKAIITEINNLDTDKADKFIQLSQELRDLSLNVGDMSGLIEALNGRINDTLNTVSERLIESTKALQKSDEAHIKRNEIIKKNTAELKKVLETPMKVNVITTTEGSTETSFADANIGGSDGLSGLSGGTPDISGDTSLTRGTPGTSTNLTGSTPPRTSTSIDNSTLTSIAGTTADILAALRELLEKQ